MTSSRAFWNTDQSCHRIPSPWLLWRCWPGCVGGFSDLWFPPGMGKDELDQAGYEKVDDVQSGIDSLLAPYLEGKVAVVVRSDLTFET